MAGTDRGTTPDLRLDLKLSLLKEGHSYSFYQVLRLLRCCLDRAGEEGAGSDGDPLDRVLVRPGLSLAFPPADVEGVEEIVHGEESRFRVTATFFGLYGVSSPLPTFYTEELMDEASDDESVSREFLDIIHHRLYRLLFQAWLKYRQAPQVLEERNQDHVERLFCLLGLGEPEFREGIRDSPRLLRYTGLFAQSCRSALGLETLLRDGLGLPVQVEPCVRRKARIPDDQRIRLGAMTVPLGRDSFLGQEMDDRMGKFRIRVGPLAEEDYRAFFPGSPMLERLVELTGLYLLEPLEYDIDVTMAAREGRTTCLGGPQWASLGLDTWLFSDGEMEQATSRFYPYQAKGDR
ncbi:MAG TPA: type VI secretion system baseplate subunit TssG [Desulfobulbus sp.]|nr:type VI secretion system baseplate subunit TssG [Desulfobulbus sp.]